jgi:transcriptional regulator with XRE-family HTH domain
MAKRRYNAAKFSKGLGLKIRGLRQQRGWTLEDCEEHGWPSWRHLQSIEAGKNINIKTLVNLANLFGVHPAEILEGL